ncbi:MULTISPECIES: acyl-CoA dehydrogenase family protein [Rhodococcus]|jgi:acyl-CoA dehydrogenase|uniref:Acyl-CoA dehydrogenase family protein n=1 Tax=Rhodococcus qingshengii TaxID=334542 RepID=A0AAW6LTC2_RHOSG|nr:MULTISPECIES: acyl-CoA dehydrogenase family protein [Rhodococcus]OCC17518.1 acyl-CoA dehydrogenase [Prescottella equi]KSU75562.1 acyl-CoA dehydrogenase [Rhodococcus qingshengii]MBP1051418.1 acyl-CoA dehydrogenase family protein [Rhodococcus qingshengii]MBS3692626.1 acyl-CoA dehydrogenase family protein [Rhodococcus qingshengii]MBT2272181.1 acyl-CoA dehydrogenase family protein [Rhodococcus qingshengii]
MDLAPSPAAREIIARLEAFMDEHVYPAESVYSEQLEAAGPRSHVLPPVVESLKLEARRQGMWNLFMPALSGLSHLDYAHIAEVTGRSPYIAPEALNCAAPDTGNMEILHLVGTREQKERWLQPLLDGTMRSGFSMTEPDVASSDARNIMTSIVRDGDEYIVNGRKWWTTGAADPRCEILVVMGKTNAEAEPHKQQSMILVPVATAGVEIVRSLPIFGYHDQHGHCEIRFDNVRVPATNMLASEGDGFAIAQARLGPGRIHHAMRCIGMAERGLDLMVRRAQSRNAFGGPISDQGVVRTWIAESRMEIEQARLLVLKTAWLIDQVGAKGAQIEIAAVKVIGPRVARNVLNRSIQCHGGGGVTDDFPIARMWASARILGIADGPDEVHIRSVARHELRKHR